MKTKLMTMLIAAVVTAAAQSTMAKALQIGPDALRTNANTADAGIVRFGGHEWFVIAYDGKDGDGGAIQYTPEGTESPVALYPEGTVTLFNKDAPTYGTYNYQGSNNFYSVSLLKGRIDDIQNGFSAEERAALASRTLEGGCGTYVSSDYDSNKIGDDDDMEDVLLWPLSVAEAKAVSVDITSTFQYEWWLRTPGLNTENVANGKGSYNGGVSQIGQKVSEGFYDTRPGCFLDLQSVLLVSASTSGKDGTVGALAAVGDYDGKDWKLTLKDAARSGFTAFYGGADGDVWTVKYGGAQTGDDEYISAAIVNGDGVVTYYGRLAAAEGGDGNTVSVDLAGKYGDGDTLYVFNEQWNGNGKTDYASALVAISPMTLLVQGTYFKATLAELGYDVPTDGKTAYKVVAKGLPAGLKLMSNKAVTKKNKKGKKVVVTPANVEWWIEGVPTAALDYATNPPYLVITVNGVTETFALSLGVEAQEVKELSELALGDSLNEQFYLPGVTNGWTVSGLPSGLKYTSKLLTKANKKGKKVVSVTTNALPYSVYGKTKAAGLFTVTAKKKNGAYYETMKYRMLVTPKAPDAAVFGDDLTNITTMAYVPVEWDLTGGSRSVATESGSAGGLALPMVSNVVKVAGLPKGVAFAAATTYKDKKKKQVKQLGQTIVGTPTKPGTYVVTFTKNVTTGTGKNKKTVAKTAQILWKVVPNDAELSLGFNTSGGVVEGGSVGLKYGDLLAFSATSNATVKASGLPAGMKLVRGDGSAGGFAPPGEAVWGFAGFTTKAGTYLVTVTATLNGKTVTQRILLKVDGLPAWAKGTFNGYVAGADGATNGLATVSVKSDGKISGKFGENGTNWTLSAACYTGAVPGARDACQEFTCSNVVAKYSYKVKEKVKGKWKTVTKTITRTFALTVAPVPIVPNVPDVPIRGFATLVEAARSASGPYQAITEIDAWQNLWGTTYKAAGKRLFYTSKKKPYKTFAYGVYTNEMGMCYFNDGDGRARSPSGPQSQASGSQISVDAGGSAIRPYQAALPGTGADGLTYFAALSLKVTSSGAVTATLSYDTGKTKKDPKTKKTVKVIYKPTCATVVIPTAAPDADAFTGDMPLFFAPSAANNFPGFAVSVPVIP